MKNFQKKKGSKDLSYHSRWLFEVVDESKKLKIGTSKNLPYCMNYERKIADIIKNNEKAIEDITLGIAPSLKILSPKEQAELRDLKYI